MIEIFKGMIPLLLAIIGVAIVIYLSYLFSKFISVGASKINAAKYMNVVDRLAVGQDRLLMILEIGEKYYLTSVTTQNIQILKELEKDELIEKNIEKTNFMQDGAFKKTFQGILASKKKDID